MRPEDLLDRARRAAAKAYSPYSNFPVGAALLLSDGRVATGCNVENASFGLTICAERAAVTQVVASRGGQEVPRIQVAAIVGTRAGGEPCFPCGACRQVLHEFGCEAVVVERHGRPETIPFSALLSHAFGPDDLD